MTKGKKTGSGKNHPHAHPRDDGGEQNQGQANGNTHVRGEVEISLSPSLIKKRDTERGEDNSREDTKRLVSVLTLTGVFIAAFLSFWQGCSTKKAADATSRAADTAAGNLEFYKQEFRMEQRPYISGVPHGGIAVNGKDNLREIFKVEKDSVKMAATVELTNTGKSPAAEVVTTSTEYKIGPAERVRKEVMAYTPNYAADAPPGILTTGNVALTPVSSIADITRKNFSSLQDGTWEEYVVGGIQYRDIFTPRLETPYETTYCYKIQFTGMAFKNCNFPAPNFGNSIK